MLQQILKDMYVDPEILAELPEEQKEILFLKIREEQVRRYNEWANDNKPVIKKRTAKPVRRVKILEDINGEPWTHVFGQNGEPTAEEIWEKLSNKRMKAAVVAVMQEETDQLSRNQSRVRSYSGGKENKTNVNSRVKLASAKYKALSGGNPPTTSTLATARSFGKADVQINHRQFQNNKQTSTKKNQAENNNVKTQLKQNHVDFTKPQSPATVNKQNHVDFTKPSSPANVNKQNHVDFTKQASPSTVSKQNHVDFTKPSSPATVNKQNHVNNKQQTATTSSPTIARPASPVAKRIEARNKPKVSGYETVSPLLRDTKTPPENRRIVSDNNLRPKTPPKHTTPKSSPKAERKQPKSQSSLDSAQSGIYDSIEDLRGQRSDLISNAEWSEQLRLYKEEDERRKIRARRASIEVKRQFELAQIQKSKMKSLRQKFNKLGSFENMKEQRQERPPLPPKPVLNQASNGSMRPRCSPVHSRLSTTGKPASRDDVKRWFAETQSASFADEFGDVTVPAWLHGIVTRLDAEKLLENRQEHDFLIRVSDKIWGYALSVKSQGRVKHFLIDASERGYHFFGSDHMLHDSLTDLV
uniref:SH2 domain-containing protein n=1 Tax=Ciona savignyi TaxID=51511 RepID=H2Z7N8_CIOSA